MNYWVDCRSEFDTVLTMIPIIDAAVVQIFPSLLETDTDQPNHNNTTIPVSTRSSFWGTARLMLNLKPEYI